MRDVHFTSYQHIYTIHLAIRMTLRMQGVIEMEERKKATVFEILEVETKKSV